METGVVTDNPTNAGVTVEDTLKNLGNVIEKNMTVNDSANTTEQPNSSQVSEQQPAADAVQAEEQKPAEVDEATKHRYAQENSRLRAVLAKFGVNADSDVIDQLQDGLITVEDVLKMNQIQISQPVQPEQPSSAPQPTLDQKLATLTEKTKNNQRHQASQRWQY